MDSQSDLGLSISSVKNLLPLLGEVNSRIHLFKSHQNPLDMWQASGSQFWNWALTFITSLAQSNQMFWQSQDIRTLHGYQEELHSLRQRIEGEEFCIILLTSLCENWNTYIASINTTDMNME